MKLLPPLWYNYRDGAIGYLTTKLGGGGGAVLGETPARFSTQSTSWRKHLYRIIFMTCLLIWAVVCYQSFFSEIKEAPPLKGFGDQLWATSQHLCISAKIGSSQNQN